MSIGAESIRVMHPLFQAGQSGSIPTSALSLQIEVIGFEQAIALNKLWHSRLPRLGTGFIKRQPFLCYAAVFNNIIFAVAIWSNPVARKLPQRLWLELRRFAISPESPRNTASRMLAVMARLIRRDRPWVVRLISYQDEDVHSGCIYRAAGWVKTLRKKASEWSCQSRPRPASQAKAPRRRWDKVIGHEM